jgi:iron(III) transport system substrate-binding protein
VFGWPPSSRRLLARASGAQSGKLVLYTSQPDRDAAQTIEAFRKAHPQVEVDVFRSGTTEVMNKLLAERLACRGPTPP